MLLQRDKVILVNRNDERIGTALKDHAHRHGILHRAISVFITNSKGKILLQQRAAGKYHSANLWSNACCSHPAPGESTNAAARRRLNEELGIDAYLRKVCTFYYAARVSDTMREHEIDHIYSGIYDGDPVPDPSEIQAWKWIDIASLNVLVRDSPQQFTAWFALAYRDWQLVDTHGI